MTKMRSPGFTADASLHNPTTYYVNRPVGASFVSAERQVQPAQIFEIERPPWWTRDDLGNIHFRTPEVARQFRCLRTCYLDCLKRYPGDAWACRWVSEQCCRYDFHCSYCGR
jgi:hypothetical protein